LESFYEKFDPDFINIRTKAREVLQREDDLNEIVQVCLPPLVTRPHNLKEEKITDNKSRKLRFDAEFYE